jgi:hypothetical protein
MVDARANLDLIPDTERFTHVVLVTAIEHSCSCLGLTYSQVSNRVYRPARRNSLHVHQDANDMSSQMKLSGKSSRKCKHTWYKLGVERSSLSVDTLRNDRTRHSDACRVGGCSPSHRWSALDVDTFAIVLQISSRQRSTLIEIQRILEEHCVRLLD